jgi:hypothetical protein
MSDFDTEREPEVDHAGAEIDEQGRNPTQRRLDDEIGDDVDADAPVDVDQEGER